VFFLIHWRFKYETLRRRNLSHAFDRIIDHRNVENNCSTISFYDMIFSLHSFSCAAKTNEQRMRSVKISTEEEQKFHSLLVSLSSETFFSAHIPFLCFARLSLLPLLFLRLNHRDHTSSSFSFGTMIFVTFVVGMNREFFQEADDEDKVLLTNAVHGASQPKDTFLAQLSKYGHSRWREETPCAKRIFCDVMTNQPQDMSILMEKRINIFLSL